MAEDFQGIFGDRYYLEMQRHGIAAQDQVNAELVKMSADLGIPLVATNDAHYLQHTTTRHHDALLCIGTAANLDDPKRFKFDGHGFYVKDGDEMREVFHDHPSAIENALADRRALQPRDPHGHVPHARVPGAGGQDPRRGDGGAGLVGPARAARPRRPTSPSRTPSTRTA